MRTKLPSRAKRRDGPPMVLKTRLATTTPDRAATMGVPSGTL
ncbi:MAG: hypothetical protein O7C98_12180 [Planctomycetota bacterium]|nr:hypothetical protein [Planctomycetota bacterium]